MGPRAFDPEYLAGTRFLHLTGITPVLSESCRDFTLWAAKEAREAGIRLSFDVNYRSRLWSPEEARGFVEELLPHVDLLFVGDEEAQAIWGGGDEGFVRGLAELGPKEVVLKKREGSMVLFEDRVLTAEPAFPVEEVDPVGAGDAFDAGYLAGHLWDLAPEERLRVASAMGAMSVTALGDYEGLPGKEELWTFLEGREELGR
jgi:2-dehydro-3-deoxygluconokinase